MSVVPVSAQSADPSPDPVPASTWVTGNVQPAPSCTDPDPEIDGDVRRERNVECSPQTWTSSDPRLTGEVSRRWNEDTYQTDEGSISVGMDAAYLRNDGGGWACSSGATSPRAPAWSRWPERPPPSPASGTAATQGSRPSSSSRTLGAFPRISSDSSSPVTSRRCRRHRLPSDSARWRGAAATIRILGRRADALTAPEPAVSLRSACDCHGSGRGRRSGQSRSCAGSRGRLSVTSRSRGAEQAQRVATRSSAPHATRERARVARPSKGEASDPSAVHPAVSSVDHGIGHDPCLRRCT